MNRPDEVTQFNRDLDTVLAGEPVPLVGGEAGERLDIVRRLAAVNASRLSVRREETRRRLVASFTDRGDTFAGRRQRGRGFHLWLYAAGLVLLFLAMNWLLSGVGAWRTIPEPAGIAEQETPTLSPSLPPEGTKPSAMPEAPTEEEAAAAQEKGAIPETAAAPSMTGPLTAASDDAAIRSRMLASRAAWETLFVDALVTTESKGVFYTEREQAWLGASSQSRWISGPEGSPPSLMRVQSGIQAVLVTADGERQAYSALDPQIGSLADLLFPGSLARRAGTFEAVREETIAGRAAVVVEWAAEGGRVEDRYWVDAITGIILKWENLFPGAADAVGRSEPLLVEVVVIQFDLEIPAGFFDFDQPFPE